MDEITAYLSLLTDTSPNAKRITLVNSRINQENANTYIETTTAYDMSPTSNSNLGLSLVSKLQTLTSNNDHRNSLSVQGQRMLNFVSLAIFIW
jgi:hypothetical protein